MQPERAIVFTGHLFLNDKDLTQNRHPDTIPVTSVTTVVFFSPAMDYYETPSDTN